MNISNNITTTFPDRFAVVNLDNQDEFVLVESYLRFATEEEIRELYQNIPIGYLDFQHILLELEDVFGKEITPDTNIEIMKDSFFYNGHWFRKELLKKEYIMVGEEKQEIINTESGDVMIEVDTEEEQVTIWDTDGDSVTLSFDELEDVYGEYSDHLMLEEDDQIPY